MLNNDLINTNSWHVAQWVSCDMSDAPPPSDNLKKSDYSACSFAVSQASDLALLVGYVA